jgi:hypothetical protein
LAAIVGVTGATVVVGAVAASGGPAGRHTSADALSTTSSSTDPVVVAELAARSADTETDARRTVSRSANRPVLAAVQRVVKSNAMPPARQDLSGAVTEDVAPTDPRDIAMSMLKDYGWSSDQFSCLNEIYLHESNWDPSAENPSSGAYGIPQALPGDKMAAAGSDWQTNPATQIAWGLTYIRDRYGSPCGAWGFWESHSYY